MKRILAITLSALLLCAGLPGMQLVSSAADTSKLLATVGDSNTHLLPGDYEKTLKKYNNGSLSEVRTWSGWAWKNDYTNLRLDFYTKDETIKNAALVTEDLKGPGGAVLKKENITATYLNTINTLSSAYPNIDYDVFDLISRDTVRDLEKGKLHEAWVDIHVPENTPAGNYTGKIYLKSGSTTLAEFTLGLEVIDMTLTNPEEWETYLELWETPFASNRYYSGLTDEEYFKFTTPFKSDTNPFSLYYCHLDPKYEKGLESELELYRKAGGNTITVHIVEGPDNSRLPCATPSMIKWTKKADGTFTYDYTDMDYWIELNMKHGINKQINFMSLAGVGWGFVYYDEKKGKVVNDVPGGCYPGDTGWEKFSIDFLTDLTKHLEEKGWFDISCLTMDERGLNWTKAMCDVADKVTNSEGKHLKVGGAVNGSEVREIYDRLYDISIWENAKGDDITEVALDRREKGLRTTLYSCGAGKMSTPNQPGEAAYAVYESYKYGVDGVMRWALNKYDYDPLHAEVNEVCYPGDCYLIYPDEKGSADMQAFSSPRFEKLCEGMRDVEKMRIIRKNYPEFAESIDGLITSLGKGSMPAETARMRKRILTISKTVLSFSQNQYTDIDSGKWYMNAIRFAVASGLMNGISNTVFDPNGSTTRAMFVTILARYDGSNLNNNAKSIFTDVPSGTWYTGAVAWATSCGLVNGVGDHLFAPNDKITREQAATFLFRYAKRKNFDISKRADLSKFTDRNKIHDYAVDCFEWANAAGIINGTSATMLSPRADCTRAQIAEMLRLFNANVEGTK